MKMTFRWYGDKNDSVSLDQIKQIPGVEGIVWALHEVPVGEVWPMDKILEIKEKVQKYGLNIDVVESVNVHEDIKLGLVSRDLYIENYKKTIENLAKVGVKVICYNFMPIFDWTRTDLFKKLPDGSTALFYEKEKVTGVAPMDLIKEVMSGSKGYTMPGWEPEKFEKFEKLFEAYKAVDEEKLWENLKYFLEQIIPVAEINGIKMAIHPDDPPWSIFGLPRIMTGKENFMRLLKIVDNPHNGITLCSGSLGVNLKNNIGEMAKLFKDRVPFIHIRNVKVFENEDFIETSHRACDGSLDICEIVKAFHENKFEGYARPDHGRHIWGEKCRPGYGLYDRALGIMYIWGIWDSLEKGNKNEYSN